MRHDVLCDRSLHLSKFHVLTDVDFHMVLKWMETNVQTQKIVKSLYEIKNLGCFTMLDMDHLVSFRGRLSSLSCVVSMDIGSGQLRDFTTNSVSLMLFCHFIYMVQCDTVVPGFELTFKVYTLKYMTSGCCWPCTLIRLISLSATSQNRGFWVHANESDEGRSHLTWHLKWKNKCRVLKIPPWHLTCFLCGLNVCERKKNKDVVKVKTKTWFRG